MPMPTSPVRAPTPVYGTGFVRTVGCAASRVQQDSSNFGNVLGADNFNNGPDTPAVKVMELAGTVVMIQESGGIPVELEKLPSIVERCVAIYRQKEAVRNMSANTAARGARDAGPQTGPKARPGGRSEKVNEPGQGSGLQLLPLLLWRTSLMTRCLSRASIGERLLLKFLRATQSTSAGSRLRAPTWSSPRFELSIAMSL